jgi:hypothetical protein
MDTCHLKVDWKGASSSHTTTSTTILSSQKIPNAVSPYQTCALLLTLNEVAKNMKLGPHPRCKEQPPLTEDLCKKIPRTTLRYWLQNNLKMEWAFKPRSQGRMSHRLSWLKGYLDPALLPQVSARRASFWGSASIVRVNSTALTVYSNS